MKILKCAVEKKDSTPKALNLGLSGVGAPPEAKLKAPGRRPPSLGEAALKRGSLGLSNSEL